MLFDRWDWIKIDEFRQHFGYYNEEVYEEWKVKKALRYGCERVNLECDNILDDIIADKGFPHGLTKKQEITVLEAAAWCANHMLKQGQEWLKGSGSISMGQVNLGQTNPDKPDYFLPFLRVKLAQTGLYNKILSSNIAEEKDYQDPMFWFKGKDEEFYPATIDYVNRDFIAKRGHGRLKSKDSSVKIEIEADGEFYGGVNLSVNSENLDKKVEEANERSKEAKDIALDASEIAEEAMQKSEATEKKEEEFEEKMKKEFNDHKHHEDEDMGDFKERINKKVEEIHDEANSAKDSANYAVGVAKSVRKDADDGKFKGAKGDKGEPSELDQVAEKYQYEKNIYLKYKDGKEAIADEMKGETLTDKYYVDGKDGELKRKLEQIAETLYDPNYIARWVRGQGYDDNDFPRSAYDSLYIPGYFKRFPGGSFFYNDGYWYRNSGQSGSKHSLHLHGKGEVSSKADLEELGLTEYEDLIVTEKEGKKLDNPIHLLKGGKIKINYFKLLQNDVATSKEELTNLNTKTTTLKEQIQTLNKDNMAINEKITTFTTASNLKETQWEDRYTTLEQKFHDLEEKHTALLGRYEKLINTLKNKKILGGKT